MLRAIALLLVGITVPALSGCGGSVPDRFVVERDLGDFQYRRYQKVLDLEFPVEGNPGVGHTASYVRRGSGRDVVFATAFVTVYDHAASLTAEVADRLDSLGTYDVTVGELEGDNVWWLDGGEDRWALWVSGKYVVKLGAPRGEEIPEDIAEEYVDTYPSDSRRERTGRVRGGQRGSLSAPARRTISGPGHAGAPPQERAAMSLRALVGRRLSPLRAYAPKPAPRIKLDANESPWPLPPEAREILARTLAAAPLHRYPDPRATRLRALLRARVGGAPEDLVVGAGSDEVICILQDALSEPREGARAPITLSVEPSFVMYQHNAVVCGHDYVAVPLREDFSLNVEAIADEIAETRPNVIFLATPNNPTGNAFDDAAVEAVVKSAPDSLVVIDEAYGAFAGRTLSGLADRYDNVALMGTLSKIGLAGARVGYCRLPPSIAPDVDKVRQPFNLSSLALTAAELALTELAPVLEAQVGLIVKERARLAEALAAHADLEPLPSDANFILVRVKGDATALADRLRKAEIAVRVFASSPSLSGYVRITVGTPEENDALLAAL